MSAADAPHRTSAVADRRRSGRRRVAAPATAMVAMAALLGVVFLVMLLLVRRRYDWLQTWDRDIADATHSFGIRHPGFVTAMRLVSDVGSPGLWWIAVLPVAVLLLRRQARRPAAFAVVTLGGSWVLNRLVKAAVGRDRPHLPHAFATATGASFPSGHAQAATVGCGILLVLGWQYLSRAGRAIGVVASVCGVFVVSLSRVVLGVHYISDVIAAAVLGLAWLLVMTAAFGAPRPGQDSRPAEDGR